MIADDLAAVLAGLWNGVQYPLRHYDEASGNQTERMKPLLAFFESFTR